MRRPLIFAGALCVSVVMWSPVLIWIGLSLPREEIEHPALRSKQAWVEIGDKIYFKKYQLLRFGYSYPYGIRPATEIEQQDHILKKVSTVVLEKPLSP